jgi:uncharacterized protein (DUF2236 family)
LSENGRRVTHAARLRSRDGYFAPESVIRRIVGSPLVTVLGVGPSVLYQSAHPLIAAGIVDHSNYRGDHWDRWLRIFRASYLMVFGSRAEADAAAAKVREVHGRIHGTTREELGPFPAGTRYSADDPELLFWVNTALTEVTMKLYGRYVRRLSIGEQERYYRETTVLARMLGATDTVIPKTLADYRVYLHERLTAPELTVTRHARDIATAIFDGPLPVQFRLIARLNRLASAGVLPARLREEYGLPWSRAHGLALAASAASVRAMGLPLAFAAGRVPQPAASSSGRRRGAASRRSVPRRSGAPDSTGRASRP